MSNLVVYFRAAAGCKACVIARRIAYLHGRGWGSIELRTDLISDANDDAAAAATTTAAATARDQLRFHEHAPMCAQWHVGATRGTSSAAV